MCVFRACLDERSRRESFNLVPVCGFFLGGRKPHKATCFFAAVAAGGLHGVLQCIAVLIRAGNMVMNDDFTLRACRSKPNASFQQEEHGISSQACPSLQCCDTVVLLDTSGCCCRELQQVASGHCLDIGLTMYSRQSFGGRPNMAATPTSPLPLLSFGTHHLVPITCTRYQITKEKKKKGAPKGWVPGVGLH